MNEATIRDKDFLIEMSRNANVIEDRPLPAADSPDVLSQLPLDNDLAIIAKDSSNRPIGAIWTHYSNPPLHIDISGTQVPEIVISVDKNFRSQGVGSALVDEFILRAQDRFPEVCLNVHVRNPARKLYERKGFIEIGKGRGELGILMTKSVKG